MRKNRWSVFSVFTILFLTSFLTSCGQTEKATTAETSDSEIIPNYASKPATLRVSLTDEPTFDYTEVHINIKHVELWFQGTSGTQGRVNIAEGLGDVDLLTLQNGVLLPLADLSVPEGVKISKIRLILEPSGHYGVRSNSDICELKTPSGQQSGVKIKLDRPVAFEDNYSYSLVIDFDAKKSVVTQGHGGCLLKPVIRLPSFTKTPSDNIPEEGGPSEDSDSEELVTDGEDSNDDPDDQNQDGYDSDVGAGEDDPVIIDPDDLSTLNE